MQCNFCIWLVMICLRPLVWMTYRFSCFVASSELRTGWLLRLNRWESAPFFIDLSLTLLRGFTLEAWCVQPTRTRPRLFLQVVSFPIALELRSSMVFQSSGKACVTVNSCNMFVPLPIFSRVSFQCFNPTWADTLRKVVAYSNPVDDTPPPDAFLNKPMMSPIADIVVIDPAPSHAPLAKAHLCVPARDDLVRVPIYADFQYGELSKSGGIFNMAPVSLGESGQLGHFFLLPRVKMLLLVLPAQCRYK